MYSLISPKNIRNTLNSLFLYNFFVKINCDNYLSNRTFLLVFTIVRQRLSKRFASYIQTPFSRSLEYISVTLSLSFYPARVFHKLFPCIENTDSFLTYSFVFNLNLMVVDTSRNIVSKVIVRLDQPDCQVINCLYNNK